MLGAVLAAAAHAWPHPAAHSLGQERASSQRVRQRAVWRCPRTQVPCPPRATRGATRSKSTGDQLARKVALPRRVGPHCRDPRLRKRLARPCSPRAARKRPRFAQCRPHRGRFRSIDGDHAASSQHLPGAFAPLNGAATSANTACSGSGPHHERVWKIADFAGPYRRDHAGTSAHELVGSLVRHAKDLAQVTQPHALLVQLPCSTTNLGGGPRLRLRRDRP